MDVIEAIERIPDPIVVDKARKAVQVLRRVCALYPLDKIAFSFNGGKDSTVLLHLLRAAVAGGAEAQGLGGIQSFYFRKADDFEEVKEFVESSDTQYGLQVEYLAEQDFKRGLCDYLSRTGVMAIVLGTRRGDPNAGGQDVFCPSSEGWPPFMRVNPILDWTYHDVWAFLRATHVPYCNLYDHGYTSLGGIGNTLPNIALQRPDGSHAPAYHLADGRLERAGRVKAGQAGSCNGGPGGGGELTRSAAIVVVGDELLSGKVEDVNARFLCKELRSMGWQVARVVFVPDASNEVASAVRALSAMVEVVLTAGGIGPTLDDVTMQARAEGRSQGIGIALAVGQPLVRHPAMVSRLAAYFGGEGALTPAHLKMAELPTGAELIDYVVPETGQPSSFPIAKVNNIYVLPGVPALLVQKWRALKPKLEDPAVAPFLNATLRLSVTDETTIAPALHRVASAHGLDVSLGSYPVAEGVIITLDSKNNQSLQAAIQEIQELLPSDSVVTLERNVDSLERAGGARR
ncbi:putative FAD synthase [Tetrabaena socialis]|uniref:FAD synthase n=1 Tax=Tetrabaena socialis TaxID=47790 RepID=A0A2J8AF91_9CHLO|nr:putative FAD synthase [Tetrabaena socialis]|eukprot:PNH11162.1 putative FAD synthase [Tetrabaena socialis]